MEARAAHWNQVYAQRDETRLSWFEAEPVLARRLVTAHADPADPVIDVGGGTARLAEALLAEGFGDVTVLDVSEAALAAAQRRLGAAGERVGWIVADVTAWSPPRRYALWHDRAVLHFLTEDAERAAYLRALRAGLAPGGVAVIATFAEDGPAACSGLPVARYAPETLRATLEAAAPGAFAPIEAHRHVHATPGGARQAFQVSLFRRL